eukprot:SAG31_NODE_2136_length_6360_cov_5.316882_1_plen_312_part_00
MAQWHAVPNTYNEVDDAIAVQSLSIALSHMSADSAGSSTRLEMGAASERTDWSEPPRNKRSEEEANAGLQPIPIWVDCNVIPGLPSEINAAAGSFTYSCIFNLYWSDHRLAGWTARELPGSLWGPWFMGRTGIECRQIGFHLVDPGAGRLQRCIHISGSTQTAFDLSDFPFELIALKARISTQSSWRSHDTSMEGLVPKGKTYRLQEVHKPAEGEPLTLPTLVDVGDREWTLHGVSTMIREREPMPAGWELTTFTVAYHCTRQSRYYFWKVMLPLHMLFVLMLPIYHMNPANLEGRINIVATYFTAAFAMM